MSWDEILRQPQAEYPDLNFVRFVARNYYNAPDRMDIDFLDIGCGAGANSKFLDDKGFNVVALDSSAESAADLVADINEVEFPEGRFDCILDFNTLCHVEKPPMKKIKSWLCQRGIFFSVCPTSKTAKGHLEGKGFCRLLSQEAVGEFYKDFDYVKWGFACYPDRGEEISSWVVEARK